MIRIISGVILILLSFMGFWGTFNLRNSINVSANIIIFLIMSLLGLTLLYLGIRFLNRRKKIINLVLKLQREEGVVHFNKITEDIDIDEIELRKSIKYAFKKGWIDKLIDIQ